jgi:hypothetical protein
MGDLMFIAHSREAALLLRDRVEAFLTGSDSNATQRRAYGSPPAQVGDHHGLTIDLHNGEFRDPVDKLQAPSNIASALLGRAANTARWLPARQLAAFARKA